MASSASRPFILIATLLLAAAGGAAVGVSCSGDEAFTDRPEPPPNVDGSVGDVVPNDAGGESCPEVPPKIGETCRAASAEETCTYDAGECTIDGQAYPKQEAFRCAQGTWSRWPLPQKGPCDE